MAQRDPTDGGDVVATLDGEGDARKLVLADTTEDGAWLTMAARDAPVLSAWR